MDRVMQAVGALVLLGVLSTFTAVPDRFAAAFAVRGVGAPADAIVVLGAGIGPHGTLTSASLARLIQGLLLYRRGLAPVIIVCGDRRESEVRAALARDLGAPGDAIVMLRAKTTAEEARQVARHLAARDAPRILLVTNPQHLLRAQAAFERTGHRVIPVPAESEIDAAPAPEPRFGVLRTTLEELAARVYYHLAG